jgi:twitching motility protein PilI
MTDARDALEGLQARLDERIQQAGTRQPRRSWLAAECAGAGLLFPLEQAGEIFPAAEILRLPHARPWFCGVANLRGGLHGVVDLAAFLGLVPAAADGVPARDAGRLIAVNPALRALCALRVDRLAGLRHRDEMSETGAAGGRPGFARGVWRDAEGRPWQEIDLAELTASESFLSIAQDEPA